MLSETSNTKVDRLPSKPRSANKKIIPKKSIKALSKIDHLGSSNVINNSPIDLDDPSEIPRRVDIPERRPTPERLDRQLDLDRPLIPDRRSDLDRPLIPERSLDLNRPLIPERSLDLDRPLIPDRRSTLERQLGLDRPLNHDEKLNPDKRPTPESVVDRQTIYDADRSHRDHHFHLDEPIPNRFTENPRISNSQNSSSSSSSLNPQSGSLNSQSRLTPHYSSNSLNSMDQEPPKAFCKTNASVNHDSDVDSIKIPDRFISDRFPSNPTPLSNPVNRFVKDEDDQNDKLIHDTKNLHEVKPHIPDQGIKSVEDLLTKLGYDIRSKILVHNGTKGKSTDDADKLGDEAKYVEAINSRGLPVFISLDTEGIITQNVDDQILVPNPIPTIIPASVKHGALECAKRHGACGIAFSCKDGVCVVEGSGLKVPTETTYSYTGGKQYPGRKPTPYPIIRLSEIKSNHSEVDAVVNKITNQIRNLAYQECVDGLKKTGQSLKHLNEEYAKFVEVQGKAVENLMKSVRALESYHDAFKHNPPQTEKEAEKYEAVVYNLRLRHYRAINLLHICDEVNQHRDGVLALTDFIDKATDAVREEFEDINLAYVQ